LKTGVSILPGFVQLNNIVPDYFHLFNHFLSAVLENYAILALKVFGQKVVFLNFELVRSLSTLFMQPLGYLLKILT
jgi:hypothetical protein